MNKEWLPRALEESRARGFLGPQPIEPQIMHAEGFGLCWEAIRPSPPAAFLDLGSGGGLPGLVLLERWHCRAVFLDSMVKRSKFLEEVLEWPSSPAGEVITARAEEAASKGANKILKCMLQWNLTRDCNSCENVKNGK